MVKQVRVIQNILMMAALFAVIVWLVHDHLRENVDAILWGIATGVASGLLYWYRLVRRISRKHRRFARNKVLVQFISPFEIILLAGASSHYILIALALSVLVGLILDWISGHWWSTLAGCFGLSASVILGVRVILYERDNGPVYYQYDSRAWTGTEGMLYQVGQVTRPLAPKGKVMVNGELWNAVSLSGEHIDLGERIEIISCKGLTLYVDRVPTNEQAYH